MDPGPGHAIERPREGRRRVPLRADVGDAPVRNEDVVHDDVGAEGPAHPDGVPGVHQVHLVAGNQGQDDGRILRVRIELAGFVVDLDDRDDEPLRAVAPAREGRPRRDAPTSLHGDRGRGRVEAPGEDRVGLLRVDLLAAFLGQPGNREARNRGALLEVPGGGAVDAGHRLPDPVRLHGMELQAPEGPRDHHPEEPRVEHRVVGGVGKPALGLGALRLLLQDRSDAFDLPEQRFGHRPSPGDRQDPAGDEYTTGRDPRPWSPP